MSKTIGSTLQTHYNGEVTTRATCWKITRTDGIIEGYTSHIEDIAGLDSPSITYRAASGYTGSNVHSNSDLSVDNLDVYCLIDSNYISSADLRAGIYDYATVEIFEVNYEDLSQGSVILRKGILGEVIIKDQIFHAEIRSLAQTLQQRVGEVTTPTCRANLGDSRCGITLVPDDWQTGTAYSIGDTVKALSFDGRRYVCTVSGTSGLSEPLWDTTIGNTTTESVSPAVSWVAYDAYTYEGTVTSVTSRRKFSDTGINKSDGHFNDGMIIWLTGNNAGYSMEIKGYSNSASPLESEFTLFESMPLDIQIGDTFIVNVGCNKTTTVCKSFYPENGSAGNIANFRGEPFVPGNDKVLKFGGQ